MVFFNPFSTKRKLENLNFALQNSFSSVKQDINSISEWIHFLHNQNKEHKKELRDLKHLIYTSPNKQDLLSYVQKNYSHQPLKERIGELDLRLSDLIESNRDITKIVYQVEGLKDKIESLSEHSHMVKSLKRRVDSIFEKIDDFEQSHNNISKVPRQLEEIESKLKSTDENLASFHHLKSKIDSMVKKMEAIESAKKVIAPLENTLKKTASHKEKLIKNIEKNSKIHVKHVIKNTIAKYGQISALQLREMIVDEQGLCSKSTFYRILEELENDENISVIQDKKEKKLVHNSVKFK